MEQNRLLTTLALVHSRFYGTELGEKAQAFFEAIYNDRVDADSAFAGRLFVAFADTPAYDEELRSVIKAIFLADSEPASLIAEPEPEPTPFWTIPHYPTEANLENIRSLSAGLARRFLWDDTEQGWDYWETVAKRLAALVGKTRRAHEHEQETPTVNLSALLYTGFYWNGTTYGHDYWDEVRNNLLALEDAGTIAPGSGKPSLLAPTQYDDGSGDPEGLEPDVNEELVRSLARGILVLFNWGDTEQGDSYWDEVYSNLLKLGGASEAPLPTTPLSDLLDEAIFWAKTPQGHQYWETVQENLMYLEDTGVIKLPSKDEDEPKPGHDDSVDSDAILELAHRIDADIYWHGSKRGFDFWRDVFKNLLALTGFHGDHDEHLHSIPHTGKNSDADYDLPKHRVLDYSLNWDSTPQGIDYWDDVYQALIEERDRQAAALPAREVESKPEREGWTDPKYQLSDLVADEIKRLSAGLSRRMYWSDTPHGDGYWEEVVRRLGVLVGHDEGQSAHDWSTDTEPGYLHDALRIAFVWASTTYGWDYWNQVANDLEAAHRDGHVEEADAD